MLQEISGRDLFIEKKQVLHLASIMKIVKDDSSLEI